MSRYGIAVTDYDTFGSWAAAYWTTRAGDAESPTDNYSYDKPDAASFASAGHAMALICALGLEDHFVVEL